MINLGWNKPGDVRARLNLLKSSLAFAISAFTILSPLTHADESITPDRKVIHAGHLIAIPGESVREKVSVIVENGVIKAIQDGFIEGEDVIDLSDSYVLPGLIDLHGHMTIPAGKVEKDPLGTLRNAQVAGKTAQALDVIPRLQETLQAGFTTVRNLGDPAGVIFELRNAVNKGIIVGPRIIAARTQVSVTGGEYDPAKLSVRPEVEATFDAKGLCDGPYACRRTIRKIVAEGADVIKLRMAGNGDFFGHGNVYEYEDEVKAIVETAHKLGVKVAAHVSSKKGAHMALKAGVDTIEHGPLGRSSFKLAKKAYFTPTLFVQAAHREMFMKLVGRDTYAEALENTRAAYKAGVPIVFGSDSAGVPHGEIAKEFSHLVDAGLTNVDAIKSATVTAAKALGLSEQIGTIEEGKSADIIATDSSPLEDVTALEKVTFVMKSGKSY